MPKINVVFTEEEIQELVADAVRKQHKLKKNSVSSSASTKRTSKRVQLSTTSTRTASLWRSDAEHRRSFRASYACYK